MLGRISFVNSYLARNQDIHEKLGNEANFSFFKPKVDAIVFVGNYHMYKLLTYYKNHLVLQWPKLVFMPLQCG